MLAIAQLAQTSDDPAYFILKNFVTPCLSKPPLIRSLRVHWQSSSLPNAFISSKQTSKRSYLSWSPRTTSSSSSLTSFPEDIKQWPAVSTQFLATRVPPHVKAPFSLSAACQGQDPGEASTPPTTRPSRTYPFPQTIGAVVGVARWKEQEVFHWFRIAKLVFTLFQLSRDEVWKWVNWEDKRGCFFQSG